MGTDNTIREYNKLATVYDRRWRHYVEASVRQTAGAIRLKGNQRVLDVGCGTGTFLRELQRTHPGLKLYGVDPSEEMLNVARRKCGKAVIFEKGKTERLPHPNAQFDVVASVSALHFFTDGQQAVLEMGRVLRPGGTIAITDWCADFLPMRLFGAWQRLNNAPLGRIYRLAQLKQLFEATGLEIEDAKHFRIRPLWGMMLVSGRRVDDRNQGRRTSVD